MVKKNQISISQLPQSTQHDDREFQTHIQQQHSVFNRKQLRKQKKMEKKQFNIQRNQQQYLAKHNEVINNQQQEPPIQEITKSKTDNNHIQQQKPNNQIKNLPQNKPKQIQKVLTQREQELLKGIEDEDKEIERVQKMLKLSSNRLNQQQIELDGLDGDLFDFLDHIDEVVKKGKKKESKSNYIQYQEQEEQENLKNQDINEEEEEDYDDRIQSEDIEEEDEDEYQENEENMEEEDDEQYNDEQYEGDDYQDDDNEDIDDSINKDQYIEDEDDEDIDDSINKDDLGEDNEDIGDDQDEEQQQQFVQKEQTKQQKQQEILQKQEQQQQIDEYPQLEEIRKTINRNINKLSETNINKIVDELVSIFNQHPKQVVSNLFAQSLINATVKAKAILPYLLSCLTVASCYFHQQFDNIFFQEIVKQIIMCIRESKEGLKNIAKVFCHWYLFESISLDFMKEFITYLCQDDCADTVENLNTIIEYCGKKMRSDNPAILKSIIEQIQDSIKSDDQRTKFLLMTLNDLRLNKKINSQAERLEFLLNWHKTKKQRLVQKVFPVNFDFCLKSEFNNNNWWQPIPTKDEQTNLYQDFFSDKKKQALTKLEQLALEQKMITETRKNIFIIIMGADDLFEASQQLDKIGYLKKKRQDIAVVILEVCGNQKNYNPYFAELAIQLLNMEKALKSSFQYAIWDKFKLIEEYSLRKQLNIARFIAQMLKKNYLNLLLLREFQFDSLNHVDSQFLYMILYNFLSKITMEVLAKQCKNLFEKEDFLPIRSGLQNYIKLQFRNLLKQYNPKDEQVFKDARIMIKLLEEDTLDQE